MRTGTANLPLHPGKCPSWLFAEMKELGTAIILAIAFEYGPQEVLHRLSDPFWFQSLGCVLGFDWHSSGVTTTVCGALKEGLKPYQKELGIYIAGGKGKTSLKTPMEIDMLGDKYGLPQKIGQLKYASKMAAKVDSAGLQDGFNLYHHLFVFTADSKWTVIQQGMNENLRYARRYHWLSEGVKSFVVEPHSAVASDYRGNVLNFVAEESEKCRDTISVIARENPDKTLKSLPVDSIMGKPQQLTLFNEANNSTSDEKFLPKIPNGAAHLVMPPQHPVPVSRNVRKILYSIYDRQPENFEELLALPGVGPGAVRALAMVAEIVYGVKTSYRDPVRYSFAHGGKDGYPFPVDREIYRNSVTVLKKALEGSKVGNSTKMKALKRLSLLEREH